MKLLYVFKERAPIVMSMAASRGLFQERGGRTARPDEE